VAAALKEVCRAADAGAAEAALAAFEKEPWGQKYPAIGRSWRRAWGEVVPFYAFPAEVRRLLYTTDVLDKGLSATVLWRPGTGDRVAAAASLAGLPHLDDPAAVAAPVRRLPGFWRHCATSCS
jgi:hypothetical protein